MNAESSRSHTIYRLCFESEDIDEEDEAVTTDSGHNSGPGGVTRMSFLNLVDLAGRYSMVGYGRVWYGIV